MTIHFGVRRQAAAEYRHRSPGGPVTDFAQPLHAALYGLPADDDPLPAALDALLQATHTATSPEQKTAVLHRLAEQLRNAAEIIQRYRYQAQGGRLPDDVAAQLGDAHDQAQQAAESLDHIAPTFTSLPAAPEPRCPPPAGEPGSAGRTPPLITRTPSAGQAPPWPTPIPMRTTGPGWLARPQPPGRPRPRRPARPRTRSRAGDRWPLAEHTTPAREARPARLFRRFQFHIPLPAQLPLLVSGGSITTSVWSATSRCARRATSWASPPT